MTNFAENYFEIHRKLCLCRDTHSRPMMSTGMCSYNGLLPLSVRLSAPSLWDHYLTALGWFACPSNPESYAEWSLALFVGPPMPGRSKVRDLTKSDPLAPQVGGAVEGRANNPVGQKKKKENVKKTETDDMATNRFIFRNVKLFFFWFGDNQLPNCFTQKILCFQTTAATIMS